MIKSFRDWISEGEQLYSTALDEFHQLEGQLEAIEQLLLTKKAEVNQIAHVIGKAPVDSTRRLTAQLIEADQVAVAAAGALPAGNMARALSGRGTMARP